MQPYPNQGPAPRTVYGLALEDGERVLYYHQSSHLGTRIFSFLIGIPMIFLLGLGLWLMYSAITMRKDTCYAQVITNRRLMAISGRGELLWGLRWEEVVGLNKVTGKRYRFGVRNAAGREFLFSEDVARVEQVITHLVQSPMIREQVPEVRYDLAVI